MNVNLPLYNDAGFRALPQLLPWLSSTDTLMLVSGNVDKPLQLEWLKRSLETLQAQTPQPVLLATAGLEHLGQLARAQLPAAGLVYIYEPDFANVPEFSWDAAATLANVERAAELTGDVPFAFKPTGRPLFQKNLAVHGWHYGAFAALADRLLVQTQTYCLKGNFADAVTKLRLECAQELGKTYAQVTLDLAARNGVAPEVAFGCARAVGSHGLAGITAWWSPRYTAEAARFLELLRQQA